MNNETHVEDSHTKTSITNFITSHKDNIATYSFFSAIIITGLTLVAKLCIYVYYSGYYAYFNIDRSYIDINNQNMFYDIFFYSACLIMFSAISLLPFMIFISKIKKYIKVILTFLLFFITIVTLYVYVYFSSGLNIKDIAPPSREELLNLIWVTCLFLFIFYMFGIFSIAGYLIDKISSKTPKKRKKKDVPEKKYDQKHIIRVSIIIIIITFLAYILVSYLIGYSNASDKTSYKIIDENHVIIYEDNTHYISSDYRIINTNSIEINTFKQKLIEKVDIETEKVLFKHVQVNN